MNQLEAMIKKLSSPFLALLSIFILSASLLKAQEKVELDTSSFAQMEFVEVSHDFGELIQGEKVEYIFHYKNIGNAPLIFQNVLTTCGCTAPEWSKNPLRKSVV